MASIKFKLPISVSKFPFLYAKASRAALVPASDVANRTPVALYGDTANVDFNLLAPLFVENMWPSDTGMFSVGFGYLGTGTVNTDFDRLLVFRSSVTEVALFCPSNGKNYVYRTSYGGWLQKNALTPTVTNARVSLAYVDGRNFVFYESQVVLEWLFATNAFAGVAFTYPAGTTVADIKGICAAGNYLIAYGDERIYWSSLSNPLDLATTAAGAGSQIPNQLRGRITTVVSAAGGFIIYTTENAVAAFATNDASRPWSFQEIKGAGGVEGFEQVSGDTPGGTHYTVGPFGIQEVALQKAENVLPDAADFLVSREVELWNYTTKQIELFRANLTKYARVNFIDNRYLFISYGWRNGQYEAALMYDTQLRRWGKIRQQHVDIAALDGLKMHEWNPTTGEAVPSANFSADTTLSYRMLRENILLLQRTGELQRLVMTPVTDNLFNIPAINACNGVMVLGHIKETRGRWVTFQFVTADGAFGVNQATRPYNYPKAYLYTSLDGAARDSTVTTLTERRAGARSMTWVGRVTADNFDIVLEGRMDLTTVIAEVTRHGSR